MWNERVEKLIKARMAKTFWVVDRFRLTNVVVRMTLIQMAVTVKAASM